MIFLPAVEFITRLAPKSPILCAVTTTTQMLGKDHVSINSNSFGMAISDANWKFSGRYDDSFDVNDVDEAITNHKIGGVVFALPLKESVKQWCDVYGWHEGNRMEGILWQRTCLMDFLQMFEKNSKVLACIKDTHPDLDKACQMAQEGKEPYVGMLDYLHARRKPHMLPKEDFTLALDARVALNEFLDEYAGISSMASPPENTNPDKKQAIQDSDFH